MNPDALVYLAILVFVVVPLVVAFVALARIRNAGEADRLGEALWPRTARYRDPTTTAGGHAGKRWDTYAPDVSFREQLRRAHPTARSEGFEAFQAAHAGEFVTGGFGRESYTFGPDQVPVDEYDHHTNDAIYRSEQGDEIAREEHLP